MIAGPQTTHRLDLPGTILNGAGTRRRVGEVLKELGVRRPLIVTDAGVVAHGLLDDVRASIEGQSLAYSVFARVDPDPTDTNVAEGFAALEAHGADSVVAVGGGSPMDCAKLVAARRSNMGPLPEYMGLHKILGRALPLVCVPTTAGTGSEATKVAVITDTVRHIKMMMLSAPLMPRAAIVDYELTLSMPPGLTAAAGVDTLTHGLEALVSKKSGPLTDTFALSCIGLSARHLLAAWSAPDDREARAGMALAALHGGMAFCNSSVCLVHGMSRPLGALFHLAHGLSNAVLLPTVTRFSVPGATGRYATAARTAGASESADDNRACRDLVEWVAALNESLRIPRLSDCCKVSREEFEAVLPKMAEDALASGSPGNNPVVPSVEDIIQLYREAW